MHAIAGDLCCKVTSIKHFKPLWGEKMGPRSGNQNVCALGDMICGGTLIERKYSRAAGATHGQEVFS